jgi:hypothetical protein
VREHNDITTVSLEQEMREHSEGEQRAKRVQKQERSQCEGTDLA